MREREQDFAEVAAALERQAAEIVHLGLFDLDCGLRERRLRKADLIATLPALSFVNVLPQWDMGERVFGPGPFVGEPIAPDLSSLRPYPFEPDACLLLCDYQGPSRAFSPRAQLATQIAKATAKRITVKAAFEFEFLVLEETAKSLRSKGFSDLASFAPANRCWGAQTAAVEADFVHHLDNTLAAGGIAPFSLGVELGPGCFEATLHARDPLGAAEEAALFRLYTKAFCRGWDKTASFMAQLGSDYPGLSGHLHLSLWDEAGNNLFHDRTDAEGLSADCRAFIAGALAASGEALPMVANSVNAYRRMAPGNWAPRALGWAVENYAAAIRAVPGTADSCRLEFRLPAADCNPFLVLALFLAGGLDGMERGLDAPPQIQGGGPDSLPDNAQPVASDLLRATETMEASASARALFGEAFVGQFCQSRRVEEAALRREVSAAERARYLEAT
ncbi:MAG: hypothetical protein RIC87_18775 [Kiloniellales bacterium]